MNYDISKNSTVVIIKRIIIMATLVGVIIEMLVFPSLGNLAGCMMTIISCILFTTIVFKASYIVEHTFAFVAFLVLFYIDSCLCLPR